MNTLFQNRCCHEDWPLQLNRVNNEGIHGLDDMRWDYIALWGDMITRRMCFCISTFLVYIAAVSNESSNIQTRSGKKSEEWSLNLERITAYSITLANNFIERFLTLGWCDINVFRDTSDAVFDKQRNKEEDGITASCCAEDRSKIWQKPFFPRFLGLSYSNWKYRKIVQFLFYARS